MNNTIINSIPGERLEDKQDFILANYKLLKLKGFENPEQSLEKFVENFFKTYNAKYITTYEDQEVQQCSVSRRRSLLDLYLICRHYYPKCSVWRVKRALFKLRDGLKGANYYISSCICSVILRRVYFYTAGRAETQTNETDEFGMTQQEMFDAPPLRDQIKLEAQKAIEPPKRKYIKKVKEEVNEDLFYKTMSKKSIPKSVLKAKRIVSGWH